MKVKALVQFEELGPSRAQVLQVMVRKTQKVNQSVQLMISHQLMPYSNSKTI